MKRKTSIDNAFSAPIGYYAVKYKSRDIFGHVFTSMSDSGALNRVAASLNSDEVVRANASDMEVHRIALFDPDSAVFDTKSRACICDCVSDLQGLVTTMAHEMYRETVKAAEAVQNNQEGETNEC